MDGIRQVMLYLAEFGVPGGLLLVVLALWRGWVVPQREVVVKDRTIETQAATIARLEAANDRLLTEVAAPLKTVLDAVSRRR